MLPQVTMECRAVADPELRYSTSGMPVAKVRTVSSSRKRTESGEWVDDKTCWLDVTCFKQMAENVAESVAKGDLLLITGRLQTEEWNDKDTNEKRTKTALVADEVAVSLRFRKVPHADGRGGQPAERSSAPDPQDPWATPVPSGQSDEPPF